MKKASWVFIMVFVVCTTAAYAGLFDAVIKGVGSQAGGGADNDTVVSGLKEALAIGTENAVKTVSQTDGYFGNKMIKLLMPEKIQKVADVLSKIGYQKQVDDFIVSMNRAAEKAAPKAAAYFGEAIKEMSINDARGILSGGDTAATEFFRKKTQDKLYEAFKPIVATSMNEVGATSAYKNIPNPAIAV